MHCTAWDDVAVKKSLSRKKIHARLQRSMAEQLPVVVGRRFDPHEQVHGIVLDVGTSWVLLTSLRDRAYFDGYTLVRLEDIRSLELDATFLPVLWTREVWPPSGPAEPLDLTGPAGFLPDIAQLATVLVLHEEIRRPDMVWIAAPAEVRQNSMWVRMIDPDCTWKDYLTKTKYKYLTRVDFGDDYSSAVLAVAGTVGSPLGSK